MVSQNQSPAAEAARTIASELGQPTRGKGVARLAAALVDAVTSDLCESEACQRMAALPGCTWVFACCCVGYTPQYSNADKAPTFSAEAKGDGLFVTGRSRTGFLDAVEQVEKAWAEKARTAAREASIRARIEREMAEADAAEAALKNTAPLAFIPDGSPADSLPVIQSTVLSDPTRRQELRDIERIDERDARMEQRRRDEEEDAANEGEKHDSGAD